MGEEAPRRRWGEEGKKEHVAVAANILTTRILRETNLVGGINAKLGFPLFACIGA